MRPPLLGLLVAALVLVPLFSGCSGRSFNIDMPLWLAGYGWEYEEQETREAVVSGEAPTAIQELEEEESNVVFNRSLRIEVFNSTAVSVEGIPIYAVAMLQQVIPDENSTEPDTSAYSAAWVYSERINYVAPCYTDWRNQEVQVACQEDSSEEDAAPSEEPTEEPTETTEGEASDEPAAPEPDNEQKRLSWPLTKGGSWRSEETIEELGDELGVFEGRATRLDSVRVPAGTFTAVRIEGSLEAYDLSEIEAGIKDSLEAGGGKVRRISFDYDVDYDYTYSEDVRNLVDFVEDRTIRLSASGKDDGGEYDFTFTQIVHIERRLVKHQLLELGEKPLTFAVDVERGIYSPKPITPASQLSLEILASAQGLNKANGEDKTTFSVRIYNSSANEKKIRAPEASFPAKGDDNPAYNHDELEVVWSFQNIDARKRFFEFYTDIGDRFVMEGKDFPVSGLKQVQATLKLKDTSSLPGQPIFTDTVSFEVYTHVNLTYARAASNVTTTDTIIVQWPVEPTAQRVYAVAQLRDVPPQGQCAVPGGGMNDCLVVSDGGSKRVVDQRSGEPMKFETTSLSNYSYGNWKFEIRPNAPGQTGVFEIVVRYRAGV